MVAHSGTRRSVDAAALGLDTTMPYAVASVNLTPEQGQVKRQASVYRLFTQRMRVVAPHCVKAFGVRLDRSRWRQSSLYPRRWRCNKVEFDFPDLIAWTDMDLPADVTMRQSSPVK